MEINPSFFRCIHKFKLNEKVWRKNNGNIVPNRVTVLEIEERRVLRLRENMASQIEEDVQVLYRTSDGDCHREDELIGSLEDMFDALGVSGGSKNATR